MRGDKDRFLGGRSLKRNVASGPGAHTFDGSSVELYKVLAPRGEANVIHGVVPPAAELLELGAGAGRVTSGLIELGHRVTAIDNSAEMLAEIQGAETILNDIVGLDLRRQFDAVILGSCLLNVADRDLRHEFLLTCARHVRSSGSVLIECHGSRAKEWAKTGTSATDPSGVVIRWLELTSVGPVLTGTLEYRLGNTVWTQSFSTELLSQSDLEEELSNAGLHLSRFLRDSWIEARPLKSGE